MFDLIITNARIVDGSGDPAYEGSVALRDGRIAALGMVEGPAAETIDAGGHVVSPGFVDVHTHYDAQVFWDPTLSPSCFHGVTTVFGGFCGFSIAPLTAQSAPYMLRMLSRVEGMPETSLTQGVPWSWRSFADYLSLLDGKVGINTGFMVGHSALRCATMGDRARGSEASAAEVKEMRQLLAKSLSEGAMGFSSTVSPTHNDADGEPVPSRYTTREELVTLAATCRDFEGTSLEFMPGLGAFSDESIDLIVEMSSKAGRPLNWNTLHAGDTGLAQHQLAIADKARAAGGEIIALTSAQYPTTRINLHSGFLFDALPGWGELFRMSIDDRIAALKSPARRVELERRKGEAIGQLRAYTNWDNYLVDAAFSDATRAYEGRTIGAIAAEQGRPPLDVMFDIAISDGLRTSFILNESADGDEIWRQRARLWGDDRTVIGGSDAGAHLDMIDTFAMSSMLLSRGVREHDLISLEQAVRQLTSVPAQLLGLKERGRLEVGHHADLVVFDPDTIDRGPVYMRSDLPGDETRVYADAIGIDYVFVNGVKIVENGSHTGALPGKVLRSGTDTATPRIPLDAGLQARSAVEPVPA